MKQSHPVHPLAAAFPEMSAEEFADLKKSVSDHGLRHKIVLIEHEGKPHILDGRHRDAACLELGIPPLFRDFDPTLDGDIPAAYVADENLNRRSLTQSQRAAIAVELEPFFAAALKAKETARKSKSKTKPVETPAAPATAASAAPAASPAPVAETSPAEDEEARKARLAAVHKQDPNGSTMKGILAAAQGNGKELCPFDEGHPARDLWMKGWDMEAERLAVLANELLGDGDLEIGTKKPDAPTATAADVEEAPATVVDGTKPEEPAAPAEKPASARAQAAEKAGVSSALVGEAKALKEQAPEKFEEVKAGTKTVGQAAKEVAQEKQKTDPYRIECADLLEGTHGEKFAEALKDGTILKKKDELDAFVKLTPTHQKEILPYVIQGWKVADTIKFLRGEFDMDSTVGELVNYHNAKGTKDGGIAIEIGDFTITVERSKPEAAAPTEGQ